MAREQVHAVTCDRCKKTEYKKEVETKRTESILTLTFKLQLPEEKKPEAKKIPIQTS